MRPPNSNLPLNQQFLPLSHPTRPVPTQRQQDRHLVDAFLGEQGRFAEVKGGFHLRLSVAQMDWLLQVLNEVRVGLWVKAGRPEQPRSMVLGGHLEPALTMELCAHFQMVLLGALGGVVD